MECGYNPLLFFIMDFNRQQYNPQFNPRSCFYCGKPGHKAADCFHQFKDMRMASKGMGNIPPLRPIRQVPHGIMSGVSMPQQRARFIQAEPRFIERDFERHDQRSDQRIDQRSDQRIDRPIEARTENCDEKNFDEFSDALAYMSERRGAMGREDFKSLLCNTAIGAKLHECLINFENQLN